MKKIILLGFAGILSVLTGCATIVNRTEQNITINSTPNDAIIQINGEDIGKTPWSGLISRKTSMQATIKKEGYSSQVVDIDGHLSGWFWGNIIFGGLVGSTTDTISGAAYEYSPGSYHVSLAPLNKKEISPIEIQSKIKQYILANWNDIGVELVGTPAERVDALREIMGYSNKALPDFAKMITADYLSSKTPDAFSEKMLLIIK